MPATGGLGTASYIRRNELTFWFGVPSTAVLMARLGELAPGAFPSLRWSLFCGEALPVRLARAWQAAAPASTLENLYGPTEATIAFTAYRVPADLPEDGVVPIGLPFDGQHVALLDEAGNAVPLGEGVKIEDIAIVNQAMRINYLERKIDGDAVEEEPTVPVSKSYILDGAMLKELTQKRANAQAEAACTDNRGEWNMENQECSGISQELCDRFGGKFENELCKF